ncbi:hypothetical protein NA57DRAFT_60297 [Rhizodiscina lignyota]|uniref:SnoaL-like domain-containing protein n=1 Tax=Rhizodiscina lignyota TaxID=1504668 RepID=A0A9P4IAB2_9PEZI|nr:hypothetical protein NA57DRAFT_60297 [Rhizodiscina lignyota]
MDANLAKTIEDMQKRLQILEDKDALWTLMNRYCTEVDNHHWEAFANTYTEDGVMEVENWGPKRGRAEIAKAASCEEVFQGVIHSITNLHFEVDGSDTATATAYLTLYVTPDVKKPEANYCWGGPYRFEYRRTPEGWRVAKQHLRKFFAIGEDTEGLFS